MGSCCTPNPPPGSPGGNPGMPGNYNQQGISQGVVGPIGPGFNQQNTAPPGQMPQNHGIGRFGPY